MVGRGFRLPVGSKTLDVRVRGASSTPLVLSYLAMVLGGSSALVGGTLWWTMDRVDNREGASTAQTITLIGAGVMVVGIAGLVVLPRTHVESTEGVRLDASAKSPNAQSPAKVRFTGNGFTF